ncbi:MAG: hypothetical protein V1664_02845 [Candidatus Uhrbacteria bacterium]
MRTKRRVINTLHRGQVEFNLKAQKGDGRSAFLEELLFIQPELPTDPAIFGEVIDALDAEFSLGIHDFGRSAEATRLKRTYLSKFRALPRRALQTMEKRGLENSLDAIWLVKVMVRAVWTEFCSQKFWLEEGVNELLLRREEIEEIKAALEALIPRLERQLSENNAGQFWTACHIAKETLRLITHQPTFVKFFNALPRCQT